MEDMGGERARQIVQDSELGIKVGCSQKIIGALRDTGMAGTGLTRPSGQAAKT